jgi:hypothetical protein
MVLKFCVAGLEMRRAIHEQALTTWREAVRQMKQVAKRLEVKTGFKEIEESGAPFSRGYFVLHDTERRITVLMEFMGDGENGNRSGEWRMGDLGLQPFCGDMPVMAVKAGLCLFCFVCFVSLFLTLWRGGGVLGLHRIWGNSASDSCSTGLVYEVGNQKGLVLV